MSTHTELPMGAQTAYAQLLEATLSADHHRSVADLKGSFARKKVKGATYWYYQYTEPSGKLRQVYVGPDSEAVSALRQQKNLPTASERLGPLARSAAALGCAEILSRHARVLQRLSEYGFFRAGGVLIGTHAFLAFGNMLGVRWTEAGRTQDVDFAHAGKSLSIALPTSIEIDADEAIKSLGMGFLPMPDLTAKAGPTYLNPREPEFRLDFVTTRHREGDKPFNHPRLGVVLQPLAFMEYLLEDVRQAVVFSGDTGVLVNVPDPARYALHKLIVFGERGGSYATKSVKDLQQAAALLARLKELRKSDIDRAWKDLVSRGRTWRARAKQGLQVLDKRFPALGVLKWLK
ncbi:MAG TPA: nucleotidyltransferase domain-containing protein [Burkholderiales bacterium]|nr:nucleotidyltransferase domain-containing protein [Burkholderiales bacterium]